MFDHPYLLVALGGLLAGFWHQVREFLFQLSNRLIDSDTVMDADGPQATALLLFLSRRPRVRFGGRMVYGGRHRVAPDGAPRLVPYVLPASMAYYRVGAGRLAWVQATVHMIPEGYHVTLRWVRRTIDVDALLLEASAMARGAIEGGAGGRRFSVRRFSGRPRTGVRAWAADEVNAVATKAGGDRAPGPPGSSSSGAPSLSHPILRHTLRPLGCALDDLVVGSSLAGPALDRMALSPAALAAFADARAWLAARDWYAERDIPWRHGLALVGAPGNGKTRAAVALAQDLDLPVIAIDLASMTNNEFIMHWEHEVLNAAPCMVLLEDLDAVFEGRENVTGVEGGLTFDCLLNSLGGAAVADGVLTVITTNRPETLDPALARPGDPTRRGRIEAVVEFGPPDEAGRRKIAARVMVDCPELVDGAVAAGAGDSGARFLDRCRGIALAHRRGAVA